MQQDLVNLRRPRSAGFSLIELMIAVAIGGIIVAIALPAYQGSVRKSRRADAFAAVSAVQQAQERWRANHQEFSTNVTDDLRVTAPPLYSLSVTAPGSPDSLANGYVVTATGRGAQATDTACPTLTARMVNGNITYTPTSCWAR